MAYLGRPQLEEHWCGSVVPSHLSPSSKASSLFTHIPYFPGLQAPLLTADRTGSWTRYLNRSRPREIWLGRDSPALCPFCQALPKWEALARDQEPQTHCLRCQGTASGL